MVVEAASSLNPRSPGPSVRSAGHEECSSHSSNVSARSQVRVTVLFLCLLLLSSARTSAQPACSATRSTSIRVVNATGVNLLRAASNCTGGGLVEADWAGRVPVGAPIAIAEGTFLSVTGEDALAEANGGGTQTRLFDVSQGGGLTLTRLKLSGGSAGSGGAVYSRSASLTLDGCEFDGNIATHGSGGAVLTEGGNVTIVGGEFSGNSATLYGGAVHVTDSWLVIQGDSRFEGNTAIGGGALFCGSSGVGSDNMAATCSITDAEFFSNSAAGESQISSSSSEYAYIDGGGAAMFLYANVAITESVFIGNYALRSGGALHGGPFTNISLNGCMFRNNTSNEYGGAISASSMTLATGTRLRNNSASTDGGAVMGWDANGMIVFNDVICAKNKAVNGGGCFYGLGRGVFNNGTVMLSNVAAHGGGIHAAEGSETSVSGGEFMGGASTSGGFLYAEDNVRVAITAGVFANNVATTGGGALYCNGNEASHISIEGGTFASNQALISGGAVMVSGALGLLMITGGSFENNKAIKYGGSIFLEEGASMMCEGATLTGNYGGDEGGGFYARDATWVNTSCDFISNVSPQGGGIYLTNVKSATFENCHLTDNMASGGSVLYGALSHIVARNVTMETSPGLGDGSTTRAAQLDGDATFIAERCRCVGWDSGTIVYNLNSANSSLVLSSCDFRGSSPTTAIISPNSVAELRNTVISSRTLANVDTEAMNSSLSSTTRLMDCNDPNACGPGLCVDSIVGVLCECLDDGECLNHGGELALSLQTPPAEVTYSPELVSFELVISAGNGTTYVIWNLAFKSDGLQLYVLPFMGVLPPGDSVTIKVIGTASNNDVGGNLTSSFHVTSVGSAISKSASDAKLNVHSTFYLCQAGEYAKPMYDDADGVSCEPCATIGSEEGVDCEQPGATLASLPIRKGFWRSNPESSIVFECLNPAACKGSTNVSSSDDYCEVGYRGPYCAVCVEGYGRGVGSTCHECNDTAIHFHIAMGTLLAMMVLLLLLPTVVYLVGGLAAINDARQSVGRHFSVGPKVSGVPEQTGSEIRPGMTSPNILIAPIPDLAHAPNLCGAEGGTSCSRVPSDDSSEPGDFDRRYAEILYGVVGTGQEVSDATEKGAHTNPGVSAHQTVGGLAVVGNCVGRTQINRRVAAENPKGCPSRCYGCGEQVKRCMSKLPLDKLKILVVVWQIISGFSSITGVEFPYSYTLFLSWISVVNIDIGSIFSASCVLPSPTFYERLLASTLTPLVLMAALVLTYHVAKYRAGNGSAGVVAKRAAWSRHVAAGLLLTFLVFTSVSTVVFQTFSCDANVVDRDSFLRADYSLSCNTNLHKIFEVYAGVMVLVYPIGIPFLYAAILFRRRKLLNPSIHGKSDRADTSATAADSGNGDGNPPTLLATVSKSQSKNIFSREELQVLEDKVEARRNHPELVSTMFLWKDFAHDIYYYEVVECARRMILTGMLVFIAPGTASQAATACLFAFGSLLGFELMRPHTDPTNVSLYRLGCVVIFLSNFLALMIKVDVAEEADRAMFGGIVVAVNVFLIAAVVVSSWITVQQSVDDSRKKKSSSAVTTTMSKKDPARLTRGGSAPISSESPPCHARNSTN